MKTPAPHTQTIAAKLSAAAIDFAAGDQDAPRRFSGIANSGEPFMLDGKPTVIDFEGIRLKPKTGVLFEHQYPCGSAQLAVKDGVLQVNGILIANDHGNTIAEAADGGFPWELSVYVQATHQDELAQGQSGIINGNFVEGPLAVMRGCVIREVSFTVVGVDSATSAAVLSEKSQTHSVTHSDKEQASMTPEEQQAMTDLQAQVTELTEANAALQKENDDLKAAADDAEQKQHAAEVDAALSAAGFSKADDGKGFAGVSATTYSVLLSAKTADAQAMIADLKPAAKAVPEALLSDQTIQSGGSGAQLSGLTADAAARRAKGASYV